MRKEKQLYQMSKNDNEEPWYEPYKKFLAVLIISLLSALFLWGIIYWLNLKSNASYRFCLDVVKMISFWGMLYSVNWTYIARAIERSINKKTVVWIVLTMIAWILIRL